MESAQADSRACTLALRARFFSFISLVDLSRLSRSRRSRRSLQLEMIEMIETVRIELITNQDRGSRIEDRGSELHVRSLRLRDNRDRVLIDKRERTRIYL